MALLIRSRSRSREAVSCPNSAACPLNAPGRSQNLTRLPSIGRSRA